MLIGMRPCAPEWSLITLVYNLKRALNPTGLAQLMAEVI